MEFRQNRRAESEGKAACNGGSNDFSHKFFSL
jgi:hypothetical protein